MLVKNNIKKTFSEKANNAASAISPLFSNIADKPDFSTKKNRLCHFYSFTIPLIWNEIVKKN